MSIIVAILALGFLVLFHELGHFLAAKACGVAVLEFSIGMGPRLLSRVVHNTRYSLKLLPFGGSCAMLGEDDAGSGDFSTAEGTEGTDGYMDYDGVRIKASELKTQNFQDKPAWKRFIICIAGVFNNFLLAFLLAVIMIAMSGFDKPYIMGTLEGSPASEAGFTVYQDNSGMTLSDLDLMTGIDLDGRYHKSTGSFRDLYIWLYVHQPDFSGNSEIHVSFLRNGEKHTVALHPVYSASDGKYRLGISFFSGRVQAASPGELIKDSFYELRYNISIVIESLRMIARGQVHRNEVMGPVGTVSVIGDTVQESSQYGMRAAFIVLLELSVMLSANLGVMNLLPVPALDGGRLFMILGEMLTRHRLDPKWEARINEIGMILLLLIMVLVLGNDIFNVITGAYQNIGG